MFDMVPAKGGRDKRSELFELYKIAIDEYRFQVTLNWNRTQYYLALNIGIVGVATGIVKLGTGLLDYLVAGLYLAGFLSCLLSLAASYVQQGYYETTRRHKAQIEQALDLRDLSIATTPGMGSTARRLGRVTTFINVILTVLAAMNLIGIVVVVRRFVSGV